MNTPEKLVIRLADHPQYCLALEYEDKGFGIDERSYIVCMFASASHLPQTPLVLLIHDAHDVPPRLSHAGRVHSLKFGRTFFYINQHDAPTLKNWLEQCRAYERQYEMEDAT